MGEKKGALFNVVTALILFGILIGIVYIFVPNLSLDFFSKMNKSTIGIDIHSEM